MEKKDILELKIRRQIYSFILKHPGLHFKSISKELNIPKTTTSYHLNCLIKRHMIIANYEGKCHRCYVNDKVSCTDKKILDFLRQDTPRKILIFLMMYTGGSLVELGKNLDRDPTTVAVHLRKLQDIDIIEPAQIGNGIIYRPKNKGTVKRIRTANEMIYRLKDPDMIYNLLIKYKDSLSGDATVDFLIKYIEDLRSNGKIPRKLKGDKDSIDATIETYYEIFPHPYHV